MLLQKWMVALLLQAALMAVAIGERVSDSLGMTPQPPAEVVVTVGD
jgi:hypothetical protein